ncbi:hypothetical protein PT2222_310089 [Paraburkholderia tropica]
MTVPDIRPLAGVTRIAVMHAACPGRFRPADSACEGDLLVKTLRIGVGAAQQNAHAPALQRLAQRAVEARERRRAGRFDRELQFVEETAHGGAQGVVGDRDDAFEVTPAQRVAVVLRMRRHQRIGDRMHLAHAHRVIGGEAAAHHVGAFRLHAVHAHARIREPQRRGHARRESAAADRHDHGVEVRRLRRPFVAERRGAEHRAKTVERMHEIAAFLGFHAAHDVERLVAVVRAHDFRAEVPALRHARLARGAKQHDLRTDAQTLRRVCHGDRMIAARHAGHARAALRGVEREQMRERAAHLETAAFLQQFELEVDESAVERRQIVAIEHGRAQHPRCEREMLRGDLVERGNGFTVDGAVGRQRRGGGHGRASRLVSRLSSRLSRVSGGRARYCTCASTERPRTSLRRKPSHAASCASETYSFGLCACSMSPGPHTTLGMPARANRPASVP